jgi:hypothetical protein
MTSRHAPYEANKGLHDTVGVNNVATTQSQGPSPYSIHPCRNRVSFFASRFPHSISMPSHQDYGPRYRTRENTTRDGAGVARVQGCPCGFLCKSCLSFGAAIWGLWRVRHG